MKPFTKVATFLLFLIAVIHVVRLFTRTEIMIAGNSIPVWVSGIGAVVFSGLALMVHRESR